MVLRTFAIVMKWYWWLLIVLLLLALGVYLAKKVLAAAPPLKIRGSAPGVSPPVSAPPVSRVDQLLRERYKMSNQDFLNGLNPTTRPVFTAFVKDIQDLGYTVDITSGYRTFQRSAELKKEDSRNATPGFSSHNYGTALDLVLIKDGKTVMKNATRAAWLATGVPQLAKTKYGMRWGGDFAGYEDNVHFDLNNKYDTKKLYAAALKQFGTVDKVRGNELDLTKIV